MKSSILHFRKLQISLTAILLTAIILFLASANVHAQPQYGCHLIKYAQSQYDMNPAERARVAAGIARSDSFDILEYEISIDLTDFRGQLLKANCIVTFTPLKSGMDHINLDLEGLKVDSVTYEGDTLPYSHNDKILNIQFDNQLNPDSTYAVQVFYGGTPVICNEDEFGGFYFENNVAYNLGIAINCIPHNFGRVWFPCFDNFVERSTYTYNIVSDDGRVGYGVGNLISSDTISSDTIRRIYHMDQPIPTYLSHVAIGPYSEINKIAESEYAPVPIQLVIQGGSRENAKRHFKNLETVLQMLEYWYGPYMWDRIGYHMTSRGAMEHPTGIAYPSSVLGGTDLGLQTHELAHHWWGNVVTLKTDADMWIKEGPSSYAEQQIIEVTEGISAYRDAVRLNNLSMVTSAHIADGAYLPLSPMPQRITYGVHTYDKGAAMMHNLRTYLGDSLYRQGMQYVIEQKAYGNLTAYTFRDLLMEGTSVDLIDFFNDWILSPGWSDFSVNNYKVENNNGLYKISGIIKQSQYHSEHFHQNVPLQLTAYFEDLTSTDTSIIVSGEATPFSFSVEKPPTSLIVNDDYELCLASVTESAKVKSEDQIELTGIRLNIYCIKYEQEDVLSVEHHYSSPPLVEDPDKNLEVSGSHYWKISTAGNTANSYSFTYNFNVSDTTSFDYHILRDGIDSLLLLYKDRNSKWIEVSEYNLIKTGSKSGIIAVSGIKDGLYALGHGESGVYTTVKKMVKSNIEIYPSIVRNRFTIDGFYYGKATIYSITGKLIQEYQIDHNHSNLQLPTMIPGMYFIHLTDKKGNIIFKQKIIKK